jgi:hypothetical protein
MGVALPVKPHAIIQVLCSFTSSWTAKLKTAERSTYSCTSAKGNTPARVEYWMSYPARVILGNHSSVIVPRQDRDSIRKFYGDVLGGRITKQENERDFLRLGGDFYIGSLYGDVPDESELLRTARSVWLEIKSDNVEQMSRRILESGLVRKLEVPDPHFISRLWEVNASG